ncbi:PAS domain-containing protein [Sphingomonas soli]|uniref:PAS domain-containing protein n=1 Tax=Sphingomonas soli TaxID=266127 RepID=UPI000AE21105|nr:LuxR C-terminal-related transcriptional regulator [Sphingomonas soli]
MAESQFNILKLCVKAMNAGIWDYDIDNNVMVCDRRWYELLGQEFDTIHTVDDFRPFIHPDDVARATAIDLERVGELIARDGRYHADFRIIRPDGEERWWRSVACVLIDPKTVHRRAVGCVTDNTRFRLLERELTRRTDEDESPAPGEAAAAPQATEPRTLSAKEIECLRWVSVGKTAWESAIIMGRSQRTVEFHLVNAVRKLAATNKIHAAVIAVREGLI